MFCPNCGSVIPDNSQFCPICGANIVELTAPVNDQPSADGQSEQKVNTSQQQVNQYNAGASQQNYTAQNGYAPPTQQAWQQPNNQYNAGGAPQQGYSAQNNFVPPQQGYNQQNNYAQQGYNQQNNYAPPPPPRERKPIDISAFYNHFFYTIFILLGIGALLCDYFAGEFVVSSLPLFVLSTISEYLLFTAFLVFGIVRLAVGARLRAKEEKPDSKNKARDFLIFGISVIVFLALLFSTINHFMIRANYDSIAFIYG